MNGFLISIAPSARHSEIAEREAGQRADQPDDQRLDHEDAAHGVLAQARATS